MDAGKKVPAGLSGIALGWLGAHKFLLGYTRQGMILLGLSLLGFLFSGLMFAAPPEMRESVFRGSAIATAIPVSIAALIGAIEGIIYLTKSDEEFYRTYIAGRRPWF